MLTTTSFGRKMSTDQKRAATYPIVICSLTSVTFLIGHCRMLALTKSLTKKASGNNIQENIWVYIQVQLATTDPTNGFSYADNCSRCPSREETVGGSASNLARKMTTTTVCLNYFCGHKQFEITWWGTLFKPLPKINQEHIQWNDVQLG